MHVPIRLIVVQFAVLALLNSGCAGFAHADPKRDAAAAISHGDLRFCAVNGIAAGMVLGTDQYGADRALVQTHGYFTLAGTSDVGSARSNESADRYARIYNTFLLQHLRAEVPHRLTTRSSERASAVRPVPSSGLDFAAARR